ncbi:LysE family translocator [Pseudonocardia nigra]|uniref:LysE family translocator n=1 Tax=Pseudonocardia nigra TaxID=1921578 RepID=UPI001C5FFD13|nr:LysE family translocator [Pseudonocardia nigra]
MTVERWIAFLGVLLVVLCTPGPDFAVVLRHTLAGARAGLRAAAGVVSGLAAHTAAAALGLSALLAARPEVLTAIRVAGAAYLVWLGVQALRAALLVRAPDAADVVGPARPYRDGLAGNLLNPKALLFFLGLIPQFVVPGPAVTGQILLLAGTTVMAAAVWFAVVITLGTAVAGRAAPRRAGARRAVDGITGAALVAVAVGVLRS